jgi:hypothetical protein
LGLPFGLAIKRYDLRAQTRGLAVPLHTLLVETWTKPELFWAAVSSIATASALVVALFGPAAQARRMRRLEESKAATVLPTLLDELTDALERAEQAVQLVRNEMAGVLRPSGTMQAPAWVRVVSPQTKKRLVELALVNFPAYEAFGDRIRDLPIHQASFLTQGYGNLLSARLRIRSLIEGWDTSSGLDPEIMRRYSTEADSLFAATSRCVFYLSGVLGREVPERLLPLTVASERRRLAKTRIGRLRLWWRAWNGRI